MPRCLIKSFLTTIYICMLNFCLAGSMAELVENKYVEDEITPIEDLMREHSVLNRILLIYENSISRINKNEFPVKEISKSTKIIQSFIGNYHEKLEENYIFPVFEKNSQELELVQILRKQHKAGRKIMSKISYLIDSEKSDKKTKKFIVNLIKKFIKMYRPHAAREDTVLFPRVRRLISENEFKNLGEKFEELEHKLFGKDGFFSIVKQVEKIEKKLGIYKLNQFTPSLDS